MSPTSTPSIHLRTAIPGPRSQALMARRRAAVPQGPFHVSPVFVAQAQGAVVTDVDGNVLLDFTGGLGTLNVGHANPAVVEAIRSQAAAFTHTCFHIAPYEAYVALAEKLNAITPGGFAKKTLLVNSGAEAVENAVKIARYYTKRPAVIAFEHGFAGRTLLTMTLTSKVMPYKFGMGPFAPEVYRMPYPYAYRSGQPDEHAFLERAIAGMREFFKTHVAPEDVACVCLELVTGEGGFIVAPPRFVKALATFCRAHGIVLIIDEIQTGFARTGTLFASEQYGLEPDLITMAKSLGGGMPISAVTGRAEIVDRVHVGGLGGTYGGNPVACAAALANIAQIEALGLCARARIIGQRLHSRMLGWQTRWPVIGDVRGLGAMQAMELVTDPGTRKPNQELTATLVQRCGAHGVILISAGSYGNVLRFLVPLIITDGQLDEGLQVIEDQLAAVLR
ncbi:MAG: 4-aminobutyrate--2-oxoglutarate transaminase [Lentisphaerae bacterium]|nr:4-aminobutyrate--2-oxoglutarate transaminase [Lentisphaerota bacterium]